MNDGDLDGALRALPAPDLDDARREQIRLRAHAALDGAPARRPGIFHRFVEPALVAVVCAAHLFWLFSATASMLGAG